MSIFAQARRLGCVSAISSKLDCARLSLSYLKYAKQKRNMENSVVTWLIVAGVIALQFVGANKKRKAAEERRKALLEEELLRRARMEEGGAEYSEYDEFQEEYVTLNNSEDSSDDPFDFLNRVIEQDVDSRNYIEETLYGKPEKYAAASATFEPEADENYESNYIDTIDAIVAEEDIIEEGVSVFGANIENGDESELYNEDFAHGREETIVNTFDPKLFILYSEIARPKYQE